MCSLLLASCSQQISDKPLVEGEFQTEKPNSPSTNQTQNKPTLIFTTPKEDTTISDLSLTVEGRVEKDDLNYFFIR